MMAVFVLLIVYQIKHFLADYPLQTPYMLGKFKDSGWAEPLAYHCGVHASLTLSIAGLYSGNLKLALGLAVLDFCAHFVMDRLKAGKKYLGRFKALSAKEFTTLMTVHPGQYARPGDEEKVVRAIELREEALRSNTYFWWCLGLDQMVHHLTHYLIIYLLVTA